MYTASRELIDAGMRACRNQLEAVGVERHEDDSFTLELAPRLFGWAAFGRNVYCGDGSMSLRPVLGLLQQDVGRLVADLARVPYKRYAYATIQTGAFTLIPDAPEREIIFEPDTSVERAAERVCAPILDPGLTWMRQHPSLEAIYTLLTTNHRVDAWEARMGEGTA